MNILAFGAHPDDIEFGCGGALIKHAQRGDKVNLFVATQGEVGGKKDIRKKEQEKAARLISAEKVFWGGLRDTDVMCDRALIEKMEKAVKTVRPDVVYLLNPEDIHQDHRAVAQAGISATRYVKEVLFFEVPTSRDFEPDVFEDVTKVIHKKIALLRQHESQEKKTRVRNLTIVESALACATFRGYQGRVRFAEGFKALRILRT